jgi:hypothetical protein
MSTEKPSQGDGLHTVVVERLRDVTRSRRGVIANALSDLPRADMAWRENPEALEALAAIHGTMRSMENAALRALADLPTGNYHAAVRAIEEAEAGWLYPIILDRALDSLPTEDGGDA